MPAIRQAIIHSRMRDDMSRLKARSPYHRARKLPRPGERKNVLVRRGLMLPDRAPPGGTGNTRYRGSRPAWTAVQGDVSDLEDLDRLFAKGPTDHGAQRRPMAKPMGALETLGKLPVESLDLVLA